MSAYTHTESLMKTSLYNTDFTLDKSVSKMSNVKTTETISLWCTRRLTLTHAVVTKLMAAAGDGLHAVSCASHTLEKAHHFTHTNIHTHTHARTYTQVKAMQVVPIHQQGEVMHTAQQQQFRIQHFHSR